MISLTESEARLFCIGGETMKLNKVIPIPVLALAAGLSLAACDGSGNTYSGPSLTAGTATTQQARR
jgi:hypothetical protein